MTPRTSRRAWLALWPEILAGASAAKRSGLLPKTGDFFRFLDPTTETPVVRLTKPSTTSFLPAPVNRFVASKGHFLVFSSDRAGKISPFHLDLKTGALTQLARTDELLPQSLCLDREQRVLYFIDGNALKQVALANTKIRTVQEDVTAFSTGSSPSEFVIVRGGRLELLENPDKPLAENVSSLCLVRPGGAGCLFGRGSGESQQFWYAPLSDRQPTEPKLLAEGPISDPFWSPDGQSLLFLRSVAKGNVSVSEIREMCPEKNDEECVASTSQFAAFAPNSDASVFVGASGSKAQPTIILLLRSARRELTLCEHRASHAFAVSPVFSPDSRRVYFQSDHQGKSALYSVNVELLVEPT